MELPLGELPNFIKEPEKLDKLIELKKLYEFWNSQINVISRKDMDKFYLHHVLHSLAITRVFNFEKNLRVLDLGCGGGFPGIPLAICFPNVAFHLVDSIGKKIRVAEAVATSLGLTNVTAQQIRAEGIKGKYFDCIVSRAVAPLATLMEWSWRLLDKKNPDAYGMICLKGGDLKKEIKDARRKVVQIEIFPEIFSDEWFREKYILQLKP